MKFLKWSSHQSKFKGNNNTITHLSKNNRGVAIINSIMGHNRYKTRSKKWIKLASRTSSIQICSFKLIWMKTQARWKLMSMEIQSRWLKKRKRRKRWRYVENLAWSWRPRTKTLRNWREATGTWTWRRTYQSAWRRSTPPHGRRTKPSGFRKAWNWRKIARTYAIIARLVRLVIGRD